MELTLRVTGKIDEDFPSEYVDEKNPEKMELYFNAARTAIRKKYNMGEEVKIEFKVNK
ncbi:MAG: hypothetical protein PHW62_00855 [Candidatus Ratteibacteria bacterium]|nr:hypothetical protein [Candidatus Ratteibacteria bacterium]